MFCTKHLWMTRCPRSYPTLRPLRAVIEDDHRREKDSPVARPRRRRLVRPSSDICVVFSFTIRSMSGIFRLVFNESLKCIAAVQITTMACGSCGSLRVDRRIVHSMPSLAAAQCVDRNNTTRTCKNEENIRRLRCMSSSEGDCKRRHDGCCTKPPVQAHCNTQSGQKQKLINS